MIFVDSSVWVAALRSGISREARHVMELLEERRIGLPAPVRVEILSGASARDRVRLRRGLSGLPVFYPDESTWSLIDEWIELAAASGERFGFADLLIGALAAGNDAELWSLDSDFERMARIGLVRLHRA